MRSSRRQWLRIAAASLVAAQMAVLREALAAGSVEKGIHRLRGEVRVNGAPASEGMDVKAGDIITTGRDGEVVFVTGKDAFLIRANSRVEVEGVVGAAVIAGLRIVTGAVLAVFTRGEPKTLRTSTANIGIRGTAVYLEVEEARTYICTCYGEAEIVPLADPAARETVRTLHHEQPRYVMGSGAPRMMMAAPVLNHFDAELVFLESLTGRRPPFPESAYRERY